MSKDNIIRVTLEQMQELQKLRPKKSGVTIENLPDAVCILIKFLDDDKNNWSYEVTGNFDRTRAGRALLAQVMLLTAEDILAYDNPESVYGLIEILENFAYGDDEEEDEE